MSFVFGLLIALIAAIPVITFADGVVTQHVLLFITALMLVVSGISSSRPDIDHTLRISRRLVLVFLFPVFWMILQIAPIPLGSFEHSIWRSVSAALDESLPGHISIDVGRTTRSLFIYVAIAALTLITVNLTKDRRRAELALFALSAVTAFSAIELILARQPFANFVNAWLAESTDPLLATSAFGAVLNLAAANRILERSQSRREQSNSGFWTSIFAILSCLTGVAACLIALASTASTNVVISTMFGIAVFLLIAIARRFGLGLLASGLLMFAAVIAAVAVMVQRFESNPSPVAILRFATSVPADIAAMTQRLVAGAGWLGSGVGASTTLTPIYQDFGTTSASGLASTVAAIMIEWGRAGLIVMTVAVIQLFVVLFTGALRRGRDSFYPGAAAACTIVAFSEAYCDSSLTDASVQLLAAVTIGLGLSQSAGRTSGA